LDHISLDLLLIGLIPPTPRSSNTPSASHLPLPLL